MQDAAEVDVEWQVSTAPDLLEINALLASFF
jgi:hypothetical protein